MSLDEKIREVLLDRRLGEYMSDGEGGYVQVNWQDSPVIDQFVEQIKDAFVSEGWVNGRKAWKANGQLYIVNGVDPITRYDGATLMN